MERKNKKPLEKSNGLKRTGREQSQHNHMEYGKYLIQSRHNLCFGLESPTMRLLLPVTFVCLTLRLTVILGIIPLIGVVRVLGSARHTGGTLFCWILSDFHCTTSFGSIIHHYKIKIKMRVSIWKIFVFVRDSISIFLGLILVQFHCYGIDLIQFV